MKHFDDLVVLFALLVIFCVAAALRHSDTESWFEFKQRCEQIHGAQAIRTEAFSYQCVPTADAVAKQKLEAL